MKSLISIVFAIIVFSSNNFAQTNNPGVIFDPCYAGRDATGADVWKQVKIGVEIEASNYKNEVEAEMFVGAAMNVQLKDPDVDYCLVPSVQGSERKLQSWATVNILSTETGADGLQNQLIRAGVSYTAHGILVAIFGKNSPNVQKYENKIQQFGGKYTNEPVVTFGTVQAIAKTRMLKGNKILWEGSSSRTFLVIRTEYPGTTIASRVDLVSLEAEFRIDDEVHSLSRIYNLRDLPAIKKTKPGEMPVVQSIGPRAQQILMLLATKEALQKDHIRLARPNSAEQRQQTTGGGN